MSIDLSTPGAENAALGHSPSANSSSSNASRISTGGAAQAFTPGTVPDAEVARLRKQQKEAAAYIAAGAPDTRGAMLGCSDALHEELLVSSLPKPYYEHKGIVIYHADCRDILPHLPKVDLVLTRSRLSGSLKRCYSNRLNPRRNPRTCSYSRNPRHDAAPRKGRNDGATLLL